MSNSPQGNRFGKVIRTQFILVTFHHDASRHLFTPILRIRKWYTLGSFAEDTLEDQFGPFTIVGTTIKRTQINLSRSNR